MKRLLLSLGLGSAAGIVDVIPMIPMGCNRYALASAFTQWVVLGFVISYLRLGLPDWLKGFIISLASVTPIMIVVIEADPKAWIPITIMSALLGSGVGYLSGRLPEMST